MSNVGRANKWAAAAYLAKVYMFEKKFAEARALYTTIIANGTTVLNMLYYLSSEMYSMLLIKTVLRMYSLFK